MREHAVRVEPKRDEEAADLPRRRLAAHDRVHHRARFRPRQVLPVQELGERFLHRSPSRKFFTSSGP